MKISDLIQQLEKLRKKHGDVEVVYRTMSHTWTPEPVVRDCGDVKFILLDP